MAPTLSAEAWAQIRYDYEHSERTIAEICAGHGISSGTLRDRMRRWGWTRRRPPIPREGPPPLPATAGRDCAAAAVRRCACSTRRRRRLCVELHPPRRLAQPGLRRLRNRACVARRRPSRRGGGRKRDAAARALGDLPLPRLRPDVRQRRPPGRVTAQTLGRHALQPRRALRPRRRPSPSATNPRRRSRSTTRSIAPRLQSAVARVLPAIETIVARLGAGAMPAREIEQAGRALGTLTRTLRELNGLLNERQAAAAGDAPAGECCRRRRSRGIVAFRLELARRMDAIVAARQATTRAIPPKPTPPPTAIRCARLAKRSARARRGSGRT